MPGNRPKGNNEPEGRQGEYGYGGNDGQATGHDGFTQALLDSIAKPRLRRWAQAYARSDSA